MYEYDPGSMVKKKKKLIPFMCSREDINNMINVDIELILFTNTDIKMLMNKISVAERDPNDIRCWRSTYQKETKLHYLSSRENQIKKNIECLPFWRFSLKTA